MNIILIGGFLGSGKTTFIRQLAQFMVRQKGKNVVIIENEAGEVSIDDKLLAMDGFQVKEIYGGCVCCQLTAELTVAIGQIKQQYDPSWIIVEASGLAKIPSVLDTLDKYGKGFESVYTIVLADAERWEELVEIMPDFMLSQTAAADLVLINKIDQVSADKLKDIEAKIKDSGTHAQVKSMSAARGVPEALLREVLQ